MGKLSEQVTAEPGEGTAAAGGRLTQAPRFHQGPWGAGLHWAGPGTPLSSLTGPGLPPEDCDLAQKLGLEMSINW